MSVIAYLISDTHFPEHAKAGSWTTTPEVYGDALYVMSQVVDLCVRDQVPVVLAGDVFDGPDPEPEALVSLYDVIRPLSHAQLPLYYILGNHDRGRDWLAPFGKFASRLDNNIGWLDNRNITVTGMSFVVPTNFADTIKTVFKGDVGVYHQTWAEFGMCPGSNRISVSDLPEHQLVVCGDIHVRSIVQPPKGPKVALSPGPLAPQSVSEFEHPVIYALHSDMTLERVPVKGRNYYLFEENDADSVIAYLSNIKHREDVPPHIAKPMVAIKLSNKDPEFINTINNLAEKKDFILRIVNDNTKKDIVKNRTKFVLTGVSTLADAISSSVVDDEVKRIASAITKPGVTPRTVLNEMLSDYVGQLPLVQFERSEKLN